MSDCRDRELDQRITGLCYRVPVHWTPLQYLDLCCHEWYPDWDWLVLAISRSTWAAIVAVNNMVNNNA